MWSGAIMDAGYRSWWKEEGVVMPRGGVYPISFHPFLLARAGGRGVVVPASRKDYDGNRGGPSLSRLGLGLVKVSTDRKGMGGREGMEETADGCD